MRFLHIFRSYMVLMPRCIMWPVGKAVEVQLKIKVMGGLWDWLIIMQQQLQMVLIFQMFWLKLGKEDRSKLKTIQNPKKFDQKSIRNPFQSLSKIDPRGGLGATWEPPLKQGASKTFGSSLGFFWASIL